MQSKYDCRPAEIFAGIGPSIGAHHYPVGDEVVQKALDAFGPQADTFLTRQNGKANFDLWAANLAVLEACGVENIEVSGLCTACNVGDWYSHRGEGGRTGRFGALIALAA